MKTKLPALFQEFFESEQASGIILLVCTATALILVNSSVGARFLDFWHLRAGFDLGSFQMKYSLEYWINDGLMGGIGFTMSIFITPLAFDDPTFTDSSKIAIILASLLAGIAGFSILSTPRMLPWKRKGRPHG